MHGRKAVDNYNRFPIKTLFGAAINCTQKHLLLLPLLPLFRFTSSSPQELPLHLLCCNFLKYFSFFSQSWLVVNAGIFFALCLLLFLPTQLTQTLFVPQFPFTLGGVPTIHSHTAGMVWGPAIQQTAEITTQVICENQVHNHPSRKEVIFIAVRYRAWIQPEERYFPGPPANTSFWCSYLRHTTPE